MSVETHPIPRHDKTYKKLDRLYKNNSFIQELIIAQISPMILEDIYSCRKIRQITLCKAFESGDSTRS